MSSKTVYFPEFASQLASGQREEPRQERGRLSRRSSSLVPKGKRGGNKRVRGESTQGVTSRLIVKFPKFSCHARAKKATNNVDEPPTRWIVEPTGTTVEPTTNPEEQAKCAGSDSVDEDQFFISQRPPSNTTNDKARHAVLMTISRTIDENQLIRGRLASLSQAS